MKTTRLGRTGVQVSAMGLGAMHLSSHLRPPEAQGLEVIRRALDLGVNFIDTADAYCLDESEKHHNERLIHEALERYDGDTSRVVVATKGGNMRPEGKWVLNGKPDYLLKTIRESFAALGGEKPIDLWQHHSPDPNVPIEESLEAAKEAVAEGLVRFVGVSNYSVEQIERAREVVDIVSVQNQYSPWHRRPEQDGVLDYCEREGLTFLAFSPLGGSSRAKELTQYEAIVRLASRKGVSPQRLVLAWLLDKSPRVLPIPGPRRVETAEDSFRAAYVSLDEEEVARIDEAAA